jgi:hypothetical protein
MTSVEGSNTLRSFPWLRVSPRKMRALACFITCLTSGTMASSCCRRPSKPLVCASGTVSSGSEKPVDRVDASTLGKFVREHVDKSAALHTDEWAGYTKVGKEFAGGHHVVNHSKREYARDGVS